MTTTNLDYPEIQERIEKQLRREKQQMQFFFFLLSIALYAVMLVIGWGMFLGNGEQLPAANIPGVAKAANPLGDAMMMVTIAGFIPLLFQFVNLILTTRTGEKQLRERITGRIMQTEMLKQMEAAQAEKSKPKRTVRLTDDGELEEVAEDSQSEALQSHIKN